MIYKKLIFTILVLFLSSHFIFGQNIASNVDALKYFDENNRWYNEFTEHWFYFYDISDKEIRDSINHWEKIGEDLKNPTNQYEGTYGNGDDTHGDYIRWSEKNGFVWLVVNKCQGGPMQITEGKVLVTPTSVRFIPEKVKGTSLQHEHQKSETTETEFLFVKWRSADFLIKPDKITNFASFTAGLDTDQSGFYDGGYGYFSKVLQAYKGSVNELPVFPSGYEKFVKKPFQAKIISIGKSYRRPKPEQVDDEGKLIEENYDDLVTEIKLDIGKYSGITKNVFVRFVIENDDYTLNGITIRKVFDNYSVGEYTINIPKKDCKKDEYEMCEAEEGKKLIAGQKLSTTGEW